MKNILVVDDEEFLRIAISKILEKEGFRVWVAGNGFQALRFLQRFKFDLIIADFDLPVMDGFSLCREIKKLKHDIPFILMSGDNSNLCESRKELINFFLPKPFDKNGLLDAIKFVLSIKNK